MLLDELDRMDGVEADLKGFSSKYHEVKSELAVAKERLKTRHAFDVLSTGTVAFGSLIFGSAFNAGINGKMFWILVGTGLCLVLVGIVAKVVKS